MIGWIDEHYFYYISYNLKITVERTILMRFKAVILWLVCLHFNLSLPRLWYLAFEIQVGTFKVFLQFWYTPKNGKFVEFWWYQQRFFR